MKKHKMEIAALTLLFGVLCYAFYDCDIKGSEQNIVLSSDLMTIVETKNNFLSIGDIKNKEDITMEMLSLSNEELLKYQNIKDKTIEEETVEEKPVEEAVEETLPEEEVIPKQRTYSRDIAEYTNVSYNEGVSNEVVNYALQFVGNPYVYGGNSLTEGTDCSGFTMLVYANFGIYLPRSAPEQAYAGVHVDLDNIMPGDIVVSGYDGVVCHASMYIGNGQLVHALNSNVGIVVTSLYIMPIIDVRRVA